MNLYDLEANTFKCQILAAILYAILAAILDISSSWRIQDFDYPVLDSAP